MEMEEVSHYLMVLMQYVQILRSLIILQKGRLPGVGSRYRGSGGGVLVKPDFFTDINITNNYAGEYGAGVYALLFTYI